jgi:ubiquitin carboxyl-terminal hydrolase 48
VQEFSKLFVCLLEKSLAHQSKEEIRTMIQKQFRGEYAYVTTCLACHRESVTPSHFYELDLALAGNKNLATCLQDFLKAGLAIKNPLKKTTKNGFFIGFLGYFL